MPWITKNSDELTDEQIETLEEIGGIPEVHHDAENDIVTIHVKKEMPLHTVKSVVERVSDRYPEGTEFHVVQHIKGLPKELTVEV